MSNIPQIRLIERNPVSYERYTYNTITLTLSPMDWPDFTCRKCGKACKGTKAGHQFCSVSCYDSWRSSPQVRKEFSEKIRQQYSDGRVIWNKCKGRFASLPLADCKQCGKSFRVTKSHKTFCSVSCLRVYQRTSEQYRQIGHNAGSSEANIHKTKLQWQDPAWRATMTEAGRRGGTRTQRLHPKLASESGRKSQVLHPRNKDFMSGIGKKGGLIGGKWAVQSGHMKKIQGLAQKAFKEHPEILKSNGRNLVRLNKLHPEWAQKGVKAWRANYPTDIEHLSMEALVKIGEPYISQVRIEELVRADQILTNHKIAIFQDGCLWHDCLTCYPNHHVIPRKHIPSEVVGARDAQITDILETRGWTVIRVWGHEVLADHDIVAKRVTEVINALKVEKQA